MIHHKQHMTAVARTSTPLQWIFPLFLFCSVASLPSFSHSTAFTMLHSSLLVPLFPSYVQSALVAVTPSGTGESVTLANYHSIRNIFTI